MYVSALLASLAATGAVGHVVRSPANGNWCGAPKPSENHIALSKHLAAKEQAARLSGIQRVGAEAVVVDTYFHIVSTSTDEGDGYLSEETVQAQMDVMNDNYASTGFSFSLKNVTRTVNQRWATDAAELDMKKALRQGGYDALNLYFLTSASGYLGYCYFPDDIAPGSDDFYYDGCTILATSVPGGPETNYDEGKTATHEIGHWFGLYHTFQGGCRGEGDFVADTPAQSSPTSGCPTTRDSCPSQAGLDPIHNYMDYSYDSCMTEFTSGQAARIASFWTQYRAGSS